MDGEDGGANSLRKELNEVNKDFNLKRQKSLFELIVIRGTREGQQFWPRQESVESNFKEVSLHLAVKIQRAGKVSAGL